MDFLLVAAGGAAGSVLRYAVGLAFAGATFPYATLVVNVLGCFLIGMALPSADRAPFLTSELRLLLVVGFLGGFTTFSTFSHETIALIHGHQAIRAAAYLSLSVLLGLAGVVVGRWLTLRIVS